MATRNRARKATASRALAREAVLVQNSKKPDTIVMKTAAGKKPANELAPEQIYKFSHARHDPATCMARGLFQPLFRGSRPRGVTHIAQFQTLRLEFRCFYQLGANDLRVLQGLIALASPTSVPEIMTGEWSTENRENLRNSLKLSKNAKYEPSLVVTGSYFELAREIGMTAGGKAYQQLRQSIDRLSLVNVRVIKGDPNNPDLTYSSNLLAYSSDNKTLEVALNPRLTAAVLGQRIAANGSHTRIELAEIRNIEGDVTRILHQYLSALLSPGDTRTLRASTLMAQIWTGDSTLNANHKHRLRLTESFAALQKINWKIHTSGSVKSHNLKYVITRPVLVPEITQCVEVPDKPPELPEDRRESLKPSPRVSFGTQTDLLNLTEFAVAVSKQPIAALRHSLDRLSHEQLATCILKQPKAALRYACRRMTDAEIVAAATKEPEAAVKFALPLLDRDQRINLTIRLPEKLLPFHEKFPDGLLNAIASEIPFDALRFAKSALSPEKLRECMENSPIGAIRYAFGEMTVETQRHYLQVAPWAMLALRRENLTDDEIDTHTSRLLSMTHGDFHCIKHECPEVHIYTSMTLSNPDRRFCIIRSQELGKPTMT